jgi:hypothetical protein
MNTLINFIYWMLGYEVLEVFEETTSEGKRYWIGNYDAPNYFPYANMEHNEWKQEVVPGKIGFRSKTSFWG